MKLSAFLAAVAAFSTLAGAEILIDTEQGNDAGDGSAAKPVKSFARGIALAQPGDTVKILPAGQPIKQSLRLLDTAGAPDRPITIDGSFNILRGAKRLTAADVAPGSAPDVFVLKGDKPWPDPTKMRFYMVFDGKLNRMGQHSKAPCAPYKAVGELQVNEWTLLDNKDLYFRLGPGKTVSDVTVEYPLLDSGVAVAGSAKHLVIKNFIVQNFLNDGYNIHGDVTDTVFENVAAVSNGDDSVSAHENCVVSVKNLIGINNGTGVCHIGNAHVSHQNLYLALADSRDLFILNSQSTFEELYVIANGAAPSGFGDSKTGVKATLTDIYLYSATPKRPFTARANNELSGQNVNFFNYSVNGVIPGLTTVTDGAATLAVIERKKAELFAIFGPNLQKVLP